MRPTAYRIARARLRRSRLARTPVARRFGPFALVAAISWLFVEWAEEVFEGETRALDEAVLLAFRVAGDPTDPLGPRWLEEAVRDLTALGSGLVLALAVLAVCGYLWLARHPRLAAATLLATAGGAVASTLLKLLFERPRPDLVPHGMSVYTASFPSGHAMLSAVVWLTLAALVARATPRRRLRAYAIGTAALLAVAVGLSRVYLGVHWPSDVVAGWLAGAAWALGCRALAHALRIGRDA